METSHIDIPEIVQLLTDLWPRYIRTIADFSTVINDIRSEELKLLERIGQDAYSSVLHYRVSGPNVDMLIEQAHCMIGRFVALAATQYSPPGSRLEIDVNQYKRRFLPDGNALGAFDPAAVWSALCDDFAGDKGKETAFGQTAASLVSAFRIQKSKPPEIRAGSLILNVRVWMDGFDQKFGRTRLSCSSFDEVGKVIKALGGFCAWAEIDGAPQALEAAANRLLDRHSEVQSRDRIHVLSGLEIITFHTRYEFRFSGPLRELILLFLNQYGASEMGTEAA